MAEIQKHPRANYVLPEVRPKFDAVLARAHRKPAVTTLPIPTVLVERINADLHHGRARQASSACIYDPAEAAELAAQPPGRAPTMPRRPPTKSAAPSSRNHGIVQMKIFPGNIRYIETDGFVWAGRAAPRPMTTPCASLRGGDAAIIDLRQNGGGSPEAVQYLISHFLAPNRPIVPSTWAPSRVNSLSSLATLPAGGWSASRSTC